MYFVVGSDGQLEGPCSIPELRVRADAGGLASDAVLEHSETRLKVSAKDVPGLYDGATVSSGQSMGSSERFASYPRNFVRITSPTKQDKDWSAMLLMAGGVEATGGLIAAMWFTKERSTPSISSVPWQVWVVTIPVFLIGAGNVWSSFYMEKGTARGFKIVRTLQVITSLLMIIFMIFIDLSAVIGVVVSGLFFSYTCGRLGGKAGPPLL